MKLSNDFDARRLRPREPRRWRTRFGMFFGLLLIALGILLTLAGAASLLGGRQSIDSMTLDSEAAIISLLLGLGLFWTGLLIRRRVRRRLHGQSGLSLSPHLGKKR